MNLYAKIEQAFDEASVATAHAFATQTGDLLLNHQAFWDAKTLSEQLSAALASRAEIEQAKDVIMPPPAAHQTPHPTASESIRSPRTGSLETHDLRCTIDQQRVRVR